VSAEPLPIVCAWCERVRTRAGGWEDATAADQEPSGATHGICPDCLAEETRTAALARDLALDCR